MTIVLVPGEISTLPVVRQIFRISFWLALLNQNPVRLQGPGYFDRSASFVQGFAV